jgi:S1-C subfamily serine protease
MTITGNKMPALRVSAMRRAVLLGGALMAGSLATSMRAAASSPPPDLADRVAPLLPSVVSIRTVIESPTGRQSVVGSGFIITPSGVVATNQLSFPHVLACPPLPVADR